MNTYSEPSQVAALHNSTPQADSFHTPPAPPTTTYQVAPATNPPAIPRKQLCPQKKFTEKAGVIASAWFPVHPVSAVFAG